MKNNQKQTWTEPKRETKVPRAGSRRWQQTRNKNKAETDVDLNRIKWNKPRLEQVEDAKKGSSGSNKKKKNLKIANFFR